MVPIIFMLQHYIIILLYAIFHLLFLSSNRKWKKNITYIKICFVKFMCRKQRFSHSIFIIFFCFSVFFSHIFSHIILNECWTDYMSEKTWKLWENVFTDHHNFPCNFGENLFSFSSCCWYFKDEGFSKRRGEAENLHINSKNKIPFVSGKHNKNSTSFSLKKNSSFLFSCMTFLFLIVWF